MPSLFLVLDHNVMRSGSHICVYGYPQPDVDEAVIIISNVLTLWEHRTGGSAGSMDWNADSLRFELRKDNIQFENPVLLHRVVEPRIIECLREIGWAVSSWVPSQEETARKVKKGEPPSTSPSFLALQREEKLPAKQTLTMEFAGTTSGPSLREVIGGRSVSVPPKRKEFHLQKTGIPKPKTSEVPLPPSSIATKETRFVLASVPDAWSSKATAHNFHVLPQVLRGSEPSRARKNTERQRKKIMADHRRLNRRRSKSMGQLHLGQLHSSQPHRSTVTQVSRRKGFDGVKLSPARLSQMYDIPDLVSLARVTPPLVTRKLEVVNITPEPCSTEGNREEQETKGQESQCSEVSPGDGERNTLEDGTLPAPKSIVLGKPPSPPRSRDHEESRPRQENSSTEETPHKPQIRKPITVRLSASQEMLDAAAAMHPPSRTAPARRSTTNSAKMFVTMNLEGNIQDEMEKHVLDQLARVRGSTPQEKKQKREEASHQQTQPWARTRAKSKAHKPTASQHRKTITEMNDGEERPLCPNKSSCEDVEPSHFLSYRHTLRDDQASE